MMTLLLAFLAQDWMPAEHGTTWTFRDTLDGRVTERSLRAGSLPNEEIELVVSVEDAKRRDEKVDATTIGLFDGERLAWILQTTPDEVRQFRSMGMRWHTMELSIPRALKDGATWKAPHTWMSCGFATTERTYTAVAERVTVPAGAFDAIRVDAAEGSRTTSMWLVKGVGIVKQVAGGRTSELVKIERPAEAAKRLVAHLEKDAKFAALLRDIGAAAAPLLRGNAILKDMPIRFQWTGDDSRMKEERVEVVRDADAWAKLWKRHADAEVPAVDFERHQVVAVFHGLDSGPAGQKEAYRATGLDLSGDKPVLNVIRKPRLYSGRFNALHGFAIVVIDRGIDALKVVRTSSNNFERKDVVETIFEK